MMQSLTKLFAVALILGSGYLCGLWSNRWGAPSELGRAVERLRRVPASVGGWTSTDQKIDQAQLVTAEIAGYLARSYVNRKETGTINVLLVCGRPGPISVHTPDICYQGQGYMPEAPPAKDSLQFRTGQTVEFQTARFQKDRPGEPPLRIAWSWNADGTWRTPENPRFEFARKRALYKLYITRQIESMDQQHEEDLCHAFARQLLPQLQEVLFPDQASER
jgi:hypothetical protein